MMLPPFPLCAQRREQELCQTDHFKNMALFQGVAALDIHGGYWYILLTIS
jgi:hypothetical protein